MRIVGGRLRGRPIAGPTTDAIRPTSDRLRQAIFDILLHAYDDVIEGARVLDLFAGTGAMGLEALSRGASFALFVDLSGPAGRLVTRNLASLGLEASARLLRRDATRLGPANPERGYDLVFCDPPYGKDLAGPALTAAAGGGWLAQGAIAVIEERAGFSPALPDLFEILERRSWGDTEVSFARYAGPGPTPLTVP